MKFLEKLNIIKKIFTADEYFITVANQHNSYGKKELGPIKYEYFTKLSPERYNIFSVVYEWTLSNIFVVIICYINTICYIF